jgi:hypothetical protein
MTSAMKPVADRSEVADHLAKLIKRRGELLPAADDAYALSELTSIEQRIKAARTGELAYDLAAVKARSSQGTVIPGASQSSTGVEAGSSPSERS